MERLNIYIFIYVRHSLILLNNIKKLSLSRKDGITQSYYELTIFMNLIPLTFLKTENIFEYYFKRDNFFFQYLAFYLILQIPFYDSNISWEILKLKRKRNLQIYRFRKGIPQEFAIVSILYNVIYAIGKIFILSKSKALQN